MDKWISLKNERPPSMVILLLTIYRNGLRDVAAGWDEAVQPEEDPSWCSCDPGIDLFDYEVTHWMNFPLPAEDA